MRGTFAAGELLAGVDLLLSGPTLISQTHRHAPVDTQCPRGDDDPHAPRDEAMRLTAQNPDGGIVSLHELPDFVRLVARREPLPLERFSLGCRRRASARRSAGLKAGRYTDIENSSPPRTAAAEFCQPRVTSTATPASS